MTARATAIVRWAQSRKPPAATSDYQFFEVHGIDREDVIGKAERLTQRFGNGVAVIVWPDNAAHEAMVRLASGGELTYPAFLREYGIEVGLTGPVL
jgi:hypothetical protein